MSSQNGPPQAAASVGTPNPFQPASLQHRMSFMEMNQNRKRAADASEEDGPETKQNKLVVEPRMFVYVQDCAFSDCVHVVVNVGTPAVKFTLCKARLQHESEYFRAALDGKKFEEGQNLTINLDDADPEAFLVYIKSLFPTCAEDFEPLSIDGLVPFQTETPPPERTLNLTSLIDLFQLIDRLGSLLCATLKQRVLKCMRLLRETAATMPWSQAEKMEFLIHFSKYNMDHDRHILEELLRMDFVIDDVETMKLIKAEILFPIVAKATAKLKSEKNILKRENEMRRRENSKLQKEIQANNTDQPNKFRFS